MSGLIGSVMEGRRDGWIVGGGMERWADVGWSTVDE